MSERPPVQFKLRLPAELLWRLEKASDVSGLSVTAEIVRRLYESFPADFEQRFVQSLREEIERQEALIAEFTGYLEGGVPHWREKSLTPKLIETKIADHRLDCYDALRSPWTGIWIAGVSSTDGPRIGLRDHEDGTRVVAEIPL